MVLWRLRNNQIEPVKSFELSEPSIKWAWGVSDADSY